MDDFDRYLKRQMKGSDFMAAWEELQPEHEINLMLIKDRAENQLTQKQIAELCGIHAVESQP